jgi:methylthioribose-1-phosphate isomerase
VKVGNTSYRTIWRRGTVVETIDQTTLPHRFTLATLDDLASACDAITTMKVRGAPLIGVTAAYGVALALHHAPGKLEDACDALLGTRPTAVNLRWALTQMSRALTQVPLNERAKRAFSLADAMADEDVRACLKLAHAGLPLIERAHARDRARPVHILTHCNAGWLATIDWGTALAPIYLAHQRGIPVHVWVDETRPRNQGASLTAWELMQEGIACTVIADNAGGHLMQHGRVDLCIVGTDRTTRNGDVCNKIGTYLKALAAHDNGVPFYVAMPTSSFDASMTDGTSIPIEERHGDEVHFLHGARVTPFGARAANPAFDVTPARLVTGLITEGGVLAPSHLAFTLEGVTKFKALHREAPELKDDLSALIRARQKLFAAGLVGRDPARYGGAGFGNVSQRLQRGFAVSGTQTGGVDALLPSHFCHVEHFSVQDNEVVTRGPVPPSSESMTHGMIYAAVQSASVVLHVHAPRIWKAREQLGLPTTAAHIGYGTAEMAEEVARLLRETPLTRIRVLAMAGHEDGIIAFGDDADDVASALLALDASSASSL